jgi:hypothetical protein
LDPTSFYPNNTLLYNVYSSYDSNALTIERSESSVYGWQISQTVWNEINYVINYPDGINNNLATSTTDVQNVIWQLLYPIGVGANPYFLSTSAAVNLYNEATGSAAQTFIPNSTQFVGVVVLPSTASPQASQPLIIQVPLFSCVIPKGVTCIPGSPVSWNKFSTQGSNNVIWVHAHLGTPTGIPTNTKTVVQFSYVTLVVNSKMYALPSGVLVFDPSAPATPTTTFNTISNQWTTTFNPNHLSDEMFFDGAAIPVDSNLSGGGQATLSFVTSTNDNSLAFSWQWSAAVFKYWPSYSPTSAGYNAAQILPYHASDHAGTPENKTIQQSLIQGPRGGGGSNYTGSWSGTGNGKCPTHLTCR